MSLANSGCAARQCAGVMDAFGKRVARLETESHSGSVLAYRCLQRMIAGMRIGAHHRFRTESADGLARRIELLEACKPRVATSVSIWSEKVSKMHASSAHEGRTK